MGTRQGSSVPSEGNMATGSQKAKQRDITTKITSDQAFPAEKLFAHLLGQVGPEYLGSGF